MPVQKAQLLFQVTTDPPDRTSASPHTGGWSESFWSQVTFPASSSGFNLLIAKRQNLLPTQASIVGYRMSTYTIVGNRFVPVGSSQGRLQKPGRSATLTDLPQVALEMSGTTAAGPNNSRFNLRCMPDTQMVRGEYQPSDTFKNAVREFCDVLVAGQWCFVGRDLTLASQRVLSINGNTVTLAGSIAATLTVDSMRLLNVKDTDGNPVKGSFRVMDMGAVGVYTVMGLTGVTAGESGAARLDRPILCPFSLVEPNRAVVRKVGRPFEGYRGRQSNR